MEATLHIVTYLHPKGDFEKFVDENHYTEKIKEWGLSAKNQFWYKEKGFKYAVTIKGYEVYGTSTEFNTIVIEFEDGNLSCIHPAYLKEMQSNSFGKVVSTEVQSPPASDQDQQEVSSSKETQTPTVEKKPTKAKEKKETPPKLELPTDKVHFTASVKQFALSWNNFNEENDEVVVLENVKIHEDTPVDVDLAWCSHSKTLKKLELAIGENLEFDGKIVKKKLPKGKDVEEEFLVEIPPLYKINNPSKIKKS
ncbi:hypothetical protein ACFYKX_01820 [Cytobacillus sp. FJAT-54145]|uniref:Uncharacterized protein n=1 Tax=Cytobacillus spartinae TaxID=3299023 RepID=A0ABW6K956_9BACI